MALYGIFTYIYHKNQANLGKYTSPMDPMGKVRVLLQLFHGTSKAIASAPGEAKSGSAPAVRSHRRLGSTSKVERMEA